jgi:hypothetical protein
MKKIIASFFIFAAPACWSQMAVYDAGTIAAIGEQTKAQQIGDAEKVAKYVQMINQFTTMINTANDTLSKLQNMDKTLLSTLNSVKCAFDRTSDMINSIQALEKRINDISQGRVFMTTQALLNQVNSGSGGTKFQTMSSLVNYIHSSYTDETPTQVIARTALARKSIAVLKKELAIKSALYMEGEGARMARQLAIARAMSSGEECLAAQMGTANRHQYESLTRDELMADIQTLQILISSMSENVNIIVSPKMVQ